MKKKRKSGPDDRGSRFSLNYFCEMHKGIYDSIHQDQLEQD